MINNFGAKIHFFSETSKHFAGKKLSFLLLFPDLTQVSHWLNFFVVRKKKRECHHDSPVLVLTNLLSTIHYSFCVQR